LHPARKIRARRSQEQVNVIRHPHEAEQFPTAPDHDLFQPVEKPLSVRVVREDRLPRIATGHQMISRAGKLNPQRPSHRLFMRPQ